MVRSDGRNMNPQNNTNTKNDIRGSVEPKREATAQDANSIQPCGNFEFRDSNDTKDQSKDEKQIGGQISVEQISVPPTVGGKDQKPPKSDPVQPQSQETEKKESDTVKLQKQKPCEETRVGSGQADDPRENESNLLEKIQRGVGKVHRLYKSEFLVFMAYTTLSGIIGGVLGSLLVVYVPTFIPLNNGTTTSDESGTTPAQTCTSCPYVEPKDYDGKIAEMTETLEQCIADNKIYTKNITNLTQLLTEVHGSVNRLDVNLTLMETEARKNYTVLTENVMLKNFVVESQISELREVFVSKEWLFIIILMGLFEVAVIGVVWMMWQKLTQSLRQKLRFRTETVANGRPSHAGGGIIEGDQDILRKVTPCELENRVCVISFHSETLHKHTEKVKDILSQSEVTKQVQTVQFLVTRHNDILHMKSAKLYLVFVDFNERNVILEDPNKGLGDLRLTAIQAIDKMGADAILTYSRDKGSSDLKPNDLYNPDLSSIRQHPELQRLDRQQRMLTVFEKFNKTQADHIVKVVKKVVK